MSDNGFAEQLGTSGEFLRAARLEKGLDIATLAERTALTEQTIACLECDDWLALPAMVYVRGYIRLICRELEVDSREVLSRVDGEDVRFNRPLLTEADEDSFLSTLWSQRRSSLAVGVAVATVLIGLLTQLIAMNTTSDARESDAKRPDITVESDRR